MDDKITLSGRYWWLEIFRAFLQIQFLLTLFGGGYLIFQFEKIAKNTPFYDFQVWFIFVWIIILLSSISNSFIIKFLFELDNSKTDKSPNNQ